MEGIDVMKNTIVAACVAVAVAAVAFAPAAGAAVADQEAVPLAQKFGENCQYAIGQENATVITFSKMEWGAYNSDPNTDGVATYAVASGAFVGSYTGTGIQAVTFELATEGVTRKNVSVVLYDADGNRYYTSKVNCTTNDGVFLRTQVGFHLAIDGWKGATAEMWDAALADVASIGICVVQEGLQEQSYIVKGFSLVGPDGVQIEGTLTPLQARLNAALLPLDIMSGDESPDRDGDGYSDLEEAVVGTDHNNAADVPNVKVLGTTDDGVEVSWNSAVEQVTYKLYRTTSLADGFPEEPVADLTLGDVVEVAGDSTWVDTTMVDPAAGPYFYKVITQAVLPAEE